jgi:hypothetical protein
MGIRCVAEALAAGPEKGSLFSQTHMLLLASARAVQWTGAVMLILYLQCMGWAFLILEVLVGPGIDAVGMFVRTFAFVPMRDRSSHLPPDGRSPLTLLYMVSAEVSPPVGLVRFVSWREGVGSLYFSLRLVTRYAAVQ